MSISALNHNVSNITPAPQPFVPIHGAGSSVPSFDWVKVYSMVALWSMADAMINNSDAIQSYIYNGLQELSLDVMKSSEMWSKWGIEKITIDQGNIQNELNSSDDPTTKSTKINALTTTFNVDNSIYQQFLQWFNSMNDGLNNTSSNTTQTQTQDMSNITQGPIALLQMLANIWTVIA